MSITRIPFEKAKVRFIGVSAEGDEDKEFRFEATPDQRIVTICFTPEGLKGAGDGQVTIERLLEKHALGKNIKASTIDTIVPLRTATADTSEAAGSVKRDHATVQLTTFGFVIDLNQA